jgi:hypothetical protein
MADDLGTFVIEEDIATDPQRVELSGPDLPHALPRSMPGFESGGSVEKDVIRLPGKKRPIYQVRQPIQRPMVIKGAFRDHLYVQAGGATGVPHARAMRDLIEAIRLRCNPVKITWSGETRRGLLDDAKFGEESDSEISYEITFEISEGPQPLNVDQPREQRQDTSDLAAQMRAIVAADRAALAEHLL